MAINMLRLFLIVIVVVGSNFPAPSNAASPDLSIETFVRGLDTPWALDFAPDGRIFISERPGRIRIVEQGQLRPEPWMTLEVAAVGEAGLLGLAVDPQFSQNRFLYVAYSYRVGAFSLRNRLVRLREDVKGKGVLDKVLIDDVAGASNHDGGRVNSASTENSTGPSATRKRRATRRISNHGTAKFSGSIPTELMPRTIHFQIPMFIRWAIGIPKAWPGNRAPDDFMPPNMDRAVSKAAAATK